MRRSIRPVLAVLFAISTLLPATVSPTAAAASAVRVSWPTAVVPGEATAIRLTLPRGVAAVDGRLLFRGAALELVGVAPRGGGTGLRPVTIPGGAAFGAYDLRSVGGAVSVDLVVVSATRRVDARVVVDSVASAAGRRLAVGGVTDRTVAARTTVRGLAPGRTIGRRDVAVARADWAQARAAGVVCGTSSITRQLDVDQDGCADIVDVQAIRAARGRPGLGAARGDMPAAGTRRVRAVDGVASAPGVITVTSAADTRDAAPGDGLCADSRGRCTLRAAIMESEMLAGDITIDFDLHGTAPVTINLRSGCRTSPG